MSSVQTAPNAPKPGAPHSLAPDASLLHAMAGNWWLVVLRGVAAIIFGILAFAWPGMTLLTLVLFWGAFALVDGVLAIIAAVKGGNPMPRWWLAIVGLAGIAAGALTFLMPGLTALVLLTFIAVWAIVLGVMEIYRRDQAAQGDPGRMVPDPQRRDLGAVRIWCCCGGRSPARSR